MNHEDVSKASGTTAEDALRRFIGRRGLYSEIRATAAADSARVTRAASWRDLLTLQSSVSYDAADLHDANTELAIVNETVRARATDPATGRFYRHATGTFQPVMERYVRETRDNTLLGIYEAKIKMDAADKIATDLGRIRTQPPLRGNRINTLQGQPTRRPSRP